SCVSGRIVNVPNATNGANDPDRIEASLNGIAVSASDFALAADKSFTLLLNGLVEGKNTVVFRLYLNHVLVTTATYEIFVFSTDAPEFISVQPLETTDVRTFIPGTNPDSYA